MKNPRVRFRIVYLALSSFRVPPVTACGRVFLGREVSNETRFGALDGLIPTNKIQPREYSRGGGVDGASYILRRSVSTTMATSVPRCSTTGTTSASSTSINWPVTGIGTIVSPLSASMLETTLSSKEGVYCANCLFQPPSILPTSASGATSVANCLLSMAFTSKAICKKYFSKSKIRMALFITSDFLSLLE